jgi:DnaD/phage-associated family protein
MARVTRDTVEYFPHYTNSSGGDTITILQEMFGNDGYAFWFRILEKLGSTDGHYIDCRGKAKQELLFAKCHIPSEKGITILETLASIETIDKEMWSHRIIWCQKFVNNLSDVYKNRKRPLPERPTWIMQSLGQEDYRAIGQNNPNNESTSRNQITTVENGISTPEIITTVETAILRQEIKDRELLGDRITTPDNLITTVKNGIIPPEMITTVENGISTPEIPQRNKVNKGIKETTGDNCGNKNIDKNSEEIGKIFSTYENNIGILTPSVADDIKLATDIYPLSWFVPAIKIAARQNQRRWTYVDGILKNWEKDGPKFDDPTGNGRKDGKKDTAVDSFRSVYDVIEGKR